jgi:ABC-type sulfate transport system substrate-binding protein
VLNSYRSFSFCCRWTQMLSQTVQPVNLSPHTSGELSIMFVRWKYLWIHGPHTKLNRSASPKLKFFVPSIVGYAD